MTRLHVFTALRHGRPGGRTSCYSSLLHLCPYERKIKRTRDLEGPWERLSPLGQVETLGHRVQMRPAARCPMAGIREDKSSGNRHPQQISRTVPLPTPDAGAFLNPLRARVCSVNLQFLRVW
jgi:hypothetical protein